MNAVTARLIFQMQRLISDNLNKPGILALAALIAMWFFVLRNALDGTTSFALFVDNEFFLGPVLASMSETLRMGGWPLRMDTILGGFPLYNLTQLSAFYPFYLLPLPLYENPAQVIHSMHMVTLVHLLIMEINSYLFLRVTGASRLAALTAAALIAFSANSFSYAIWINIVAPYAWLPLFLAGIVGLAKARHLFRYSVMTWVGIVMLTFASPAQPLIHAIFTAGVFFSAFAIARYRKGETRELALLSRHLAVLALLTFLVVSPVLLPAVFDLDDMIRWIGDFPPVYDNERIPFAAFQTEQLALGDLGGVLYMFRGGAIGQQFVGVTVMVLALVKVVSRPHSWIVNALIFIAAYSLLSSAGSNLGLAYLNYWIPLINKIREPTRFLFLFQFAICTLAALGIDELRLIAANRDGRKLTRRHWVVVSAALVLAMFTCLFLSERIVSVIPPFFSIAIIIVLLVLTWLAPRLAFKAPGSLIAWAWSIAALATLAQEVTWLPPPTSYSDFLTSNLAPLDTAIQRVAQLDPARDYRLIFDGTINKQVAAMLASSHGVRTLNAYVNPAPRRQFDDLYYHGARADNYVRVLGAKYLLCSECSAEAVNGYRYFESIAGYELYEAEEVLPHSYIARSISGNYAHLGDFTAKAVAAPLNEHFLFIGTRSAPLWPELADPEAEPGTCTRKEALRSTNKVSVAVQCQSAAFLVLNEFHDGNWKARLDGASTELLKVNGNQMAVHFPAGAHMVEFQYRPTIFSITLTLFVLGALLSLYLLVVKSREMMPEVAHVLKGTSGN